MPKLSEHGQDYTVVVLEAPRPDGQGMGRAEEVPVRATTIGPVSARTGLIESDA